MCPSRTNKQPHTWLLHLHSVGRQKGAIMKPSQVARTLKTLINARQPTMIWGPPGAGKSQIVAQVAKGYGEFLDIRLPLLDAVDLRGIPTIKDGRTEWVTPAMFPRKGKGVLFLDELVQAMPIVQSAASQLILDRKIGEYTLPDGWAVVAAGNRETDRAATNRMPSHIANRFTHLNFEVDPEDWIEWAFANDINPMVIAFIGFKPELLHKFDPKQKAFPTPRSWEFVSNILNHNGVDECLQEVVAGTVGEGASVEFVGFVRVFREMPDYETICKRPGGTKVPENVAARYAVATMLAQRTKNEDMKAVMQYVNRMPTEFQILTTQDMVRRNKRLAETSAYINWAANNSKTLINATVR